jgi:hypothetical protein
MGIWTGEMGDTLLRRSFRRGDEKIIAFERVHIFPGRSISDIQLRQQTIGVIKALLIRPFCALRDSIFTPTHDVAD